MTRTLEVQRLAVSLRPGGVYQDIYEALEPGVRENEVVALATKRLYEMGSDCVEAINSISGERCSPHPHNFTDHLIRPGDQAFFDIIMSFTGELPIANKY